MDRRNFIGVLAGVAAAPSVLICGRRPQPLIARTPAATEFAIRGRCFAHWANSSASLERETVEIEQIACEVASPQSWKLLFEFAPPHSMVITRLELFVWFANQWWPATYQEKEYALFGGIFCVIWPFEIR
jgi:hypothetical protein